MRLAGEQPVVLGDLAGAGLVLVALAVLPVWWAVRRERQVAEVGDRNHTGAEYATSATVG